MSSADVIAYVLAAGIGGFIVGFIVGFVTPEWMFWTKPEPSEKKGS